MGIAEGCSSDSDDDLYTKSVDIRKVRGVSTIRSIVTEVSPNSSRTKESSNKVDVEVLDDDESLDLPDLDCAFPLKARQSRRKRVEQLAQKELLELEEILCEPVVEITAPCPKRTRRVNSYDHSEDHSHVANGCRSSPSLELNKSTNTKSSGSEVIELDKEVNLFVTVFIDKQVGKTGRFMSILHDEPFDKLRPEFAKELKCNQLDVMIHVNNVDAGPGDTPDSMGLNIEKLALVNVFSLRPNTNSEEDLSTDPNFIPVKCIFASGRPRCVYIKLTENFAEAKKRIEKALRLSSRVEKLVFDNDILSDSETPISVDMEAEDVVEVHLKNSS